MGRAPWRCAFLFTLSLLSIAGAHAQLLPPGLSFTDLQNGILTGPLRYLPAPLLAQELLCATGGLSDPEREALVESLLLVSGEDDDDQAEVALAAAVLADFDRLANWSLRSMVLSISSEYGVPGVDAAVLSSARRIADLLADPSGSPALQGYEREAVTTARLAPEYGSNALAELLRQIARLSRNAEVVEAARRAAREILETQ
jgi:hypothetical protein